MEKQKVALKVQGSNGIKELLRNPAITTRISGSKVETELVLQQIQRDIVDSCDCHEDGWAVVRAIDVIKDTLLMFSVQGVQHLQEEAEEAAKLSR